MRDLFFAMSIGFFILVVFFPEIIVGYQMMWSFCKLLNQGDTVGAITCMIEGRP